MTIFILAPLRTDVTESSVTSVASYGKGNPFIDDDDDVEVAGHCKGLDQRKIVNAVAQEPLVK